MGPERHIVALPWGDVSYLEWRPVVPSSASAVLLLHGGGLDSAWLSWGGVGGALAAAGHRVIAPDHPGYGRSPKAPWPATQHHLLGYLDAFVGALQLDRCALGGLSMGGGLALGHVLAHPQRVTAMVLLGSYGLTPTIVEGRWRAVAQLASWAATRSGLMSAAARATMRSRALAERSLRPVLRDPAQRTPELIDAVIAEAAHGSGIASFAEFQRDEVGPRRQRTDFSDRLPTIATPTLLVHGERDAGVPASVARRAAEAMPDARILVVPDAGHWVQRDRPQAVVPAMIAFLDGRD